MGFLCGLKFFALNIFCGQYLQSSLHLMLQIWWKPLLWKMCQWIMMRFFTYRPVKLMFGKMVLAPYLVVPLICTRVPLISTRVSAHCQAILLLGLMSSCLKFESSSSFEDQAPLNFIKIMMKFVCKKYDTAGKEEGWWMLSEVNRILLYGMDGTGYGCWMVIERGKYPDGKVHGASMGPTWVLSAPDGPHVGPINLPIRVEFRLYGIAATSRGVGDELVIQEFTVWDSPNRVMVVLDDEQGKLNFTIWVS